MTAPKPARKTLPRGAGSFAIIRSLIRFGEDDHEEGSTTALARQARVSQPRASQVLTQLLSQEYPGPGGSTLYFYGLNPPTEATARAASTLGKRVAVSADVGPDLIAPWRRPSKVILYVTDLIDPGDLGLVEAQESHDANALVCMPADRSVFPAHALTARAHGTQIWLADPAQMIWDLQRLGGSDRSEAAGELRTWLLARR